MGIANTSVPSSGQSRRHTVQTLVVSKCRTSCLQHAGTMHSSARALANGLLVNVDHAVSEAIYAQYSVHVCGVNDECGAVELTRHSH